MNELLCLFHTCPFYCPLLFVSVVLSVDRLTVESAH